MIPGVGIDRIVTSSAMNGMPANWIRDSLEAAGLDVAGLPSTRTAMPEGVRPWRDLYSAGQSVGLIDRVETVADLVARLSKEFAALEPRGDWRDRLGAIEAGWA
jgi:nitronate monooxygenase